MSGLRQRRRRQFDGYRMALLLEPITTLSKGTVRDTLYAIEGGALTPPGLGPPGSPRRRLSLIQRSMLRAAEHIATQWLSRFFKDRKNKKGEHR